MYILREMKTENTKPSIIDNKGGPSKTSNSEIMIILSNFRKNVYSYFGYFLEISKYLNVSWKHNMFLSRHLKFQNGEKGSFCFET